MPTKKVKDMMNEKKNMTSKALPLSIPKIVFRKIVKQLLQEVLEKRYTSNMDNKLRKIKVYDTAYMALQSDAEEFLIQRFAKASDLSVLMKDKTLALKHFLDAHKRPVQNAIETV